ncbi:hypothetical protein KBX71_17875 [Micromonospora sp. D93]|uniref:tetratricopeptide repeat protein n=1 Tax=Micromonospora sp. D93 TaxID=2824886 RepID=UPI001B38792A|nr:hypothetical protein [Micromonospora sp. D93]MBQ1019720.1 hypothetical protein [Micromonospora sp. D93]
MKHQLGRSLAGRRLVKRLVRDLDLLTLGVHPSIESGRAGAPDDASAYIPRDHDQLLKRSIAESRTATRFILLVGESSTGKTRSAAERVLDELRDWQIIVPLTLTRLRQVFEEVTDWDETVLWLNELQNFLIEEDADEVAATLIDLLDGARRCVVIGTLWPSYAKEYMRHSGTDEQAPARPTSGGLQALFHRAVIIYVGSRLSDREMTAAVAIAEHDAAIKTALMTSEGSAGAVTQTLAAGPDLLRHLRMAPDAFSRKLIAGAVDARLLGRAAPLTTSDLKIITVALLDPHERARALLDEMWFDSAMRFATETLRGTAALLNPTMTAADELGYILADYVYEQLHRERALLTVEYGLWEALRQIITDSEESYQLAASAVRRGATEPAESFYRISIDRGSVRASVALAKLLAAQLRTEEAEQVFADAFVSDPVEVWLDYSRFLRSQDRADECEVVLRRAMKAGVPAFEGGSSSGRHDAATGRDEYLGPALGWTISVHLFGPQSELEELLRSQSRADEVIDVWRDAVNRGVPFANLHLAGLLAKDQEFDDAEAILRHETEDGTPSARYELADFLRQLGRTGEVLQVWREGAANDEPEAGRIYASILEGRSRYVEAEAVLRSAVARGIPGASRDLSDFLQRQHRPEDAFAVLMEARTADLPGVRVPLAKLAARRADWDSAESLLQEAVDRREPDAWVVLVRLIFEVRGLSEEVGTILLQEAARGSRGAAGCLMRLRMLQGRTTDAAASWRDLLPYANHDDQLGLAALCAWTGDLAGAEAELRAAVTRGVQHSEEALVSFLVCRGEPGSIESVWRQSIAAGNYQARQELADHLAELGRVAEAENVLRESVLAGELNSGQALGRFLAARDRRDEAMAILISALENGETTVGSLIFRILVEDGEFERAEEFAREHPGPLFERNRHLAWLEQSRGNLDKAEDLLYAAVEGREFSAEEDLEDFLLAYGRPRRPLPNDSLSQRRVAEMLQLGSVEEAHSLQYEIDREQRIDYLRVHSAESEEELHGAVRDGTWESLGSLVTYLLEEMRFDEALTMAQQGVVLDEFKSYLILAQALAAAGEKQGAISALWAGVAVGQPAAAATLRSTLS